MAAFCNRLRVQIDDEVDTTYPERRIGKVPVETAGGRRIEARVDEPKGDPGLLRPTRRTSAERSTDSQTRDQRHTP